MAVNMLCGESWPCIQVGNFAMRMQKVLEDNSYKGGWHEMSAKECIKKAKSELDQIKSKGHTELSTAEQKAVIDCANYLMFALDNADKPESEWASRRARPGKREHNG